MAGTKQNMKRRSWWAEVALVAGVLGFTTAAVAVRPRVPAPAKPVAKVASPAPASTQSPAPTLATPPDPFTIAGLKAHAYAASPIATVRNLGDLGGYSASVVAFTSDGLREYAYMAQPDGAAPAGGWPVIVFVHGYIAPANYSTTGNAYSTWIRAWARAGFVVVQPDLRGNGQSGGTAVSPHWSTEYTWDVMNLLASLKADPGINPKRIGLAGHSMGGHIALNAAVISPDVRATVLVNGVVGTMYDLLYNWPNAPWPNDQPTAVTRGELAALEAAHGNPKDNPAWWDSASAIKCAGSVSGPVQIDADAGDTVVPYAFSQELSGALGAAGKPVTLYTYAGNDHQLSHSGNLNLLEARTTAFWQQALQ